ncbi:hypothetical protein ES708_33483 [subsurface metagenome]
MNNFAVLDLAYTHYDAGIYICVKTDVPCHLTLYHTTSAPRRHRTSRNQRGLTLPWGVYFCFVSWTAVEQEQEGDTLYHLFNVYPWMVLTTKWFAFRGTINGELSPSVSALFEHNHPGGLPMEVDLRVYGLGYQCHPNLDGTGPPCPDHWKSVTTLPGYPPEWYLVGNTINHWWGYEGYLIERGRLEKIDSITHRMKVKRLGSRPAARVHAHLLRIAGVNYIIEINYTSTYWKEFEHTYAENPATGKPWTQQDLDPLQIGVGLRHTWSIGWSETGACDEVYLHVSRGIICPP